MECVRFWFELSREPKLINDRFIITFHIYNHCTDSVRVIMVKNVLIACLECLSVGRGGISSGQDIIFPRSLIIDPGKLISIEMKVQIIDSGVFTFYPALFYEIADEKRIVNAEIAPIPGTRLRRETSCVSFAILSIFTFHSSMYLSRLSMRDKYCGNISL